jgi:hypothetical protein
MSEQVSEIAWAFEDLQTIGVTLEQWERFVEFMNDSAMRFFSCSHEFVFENGCVECGESI